MEAKIDSGNRKSNQGIRKLLGPYALFSSVILIVLLITNSLMYSSVVKLKDRLDETEKKLDQVKMEKAIGGAESSLQDSIVQQSQGTQNFSSTTEGETGQQPVSVAGIEGNPDGQDAGTIEVIEITPGDGTDQTHPETNVSRPETASGQPSRSKTPEEVTEAYNQAYSACKNGQYDQAIEMFQQILDHPGSHQLKDNAQYWLAECYYAQKKYVQALAEFEKVKKLFPNGDKVFDAELKIAYTYYKLNRISAAKPRLEQLSRDWPQTKYQAKIAILSEMIESVQNN